jgi:hypothetical protein
MPTAAVAYAAPPPRVRLARPTADRLRRGDPDAEPVMIQAALSVEPAAPRAYTSPVPAPGAATTVAAVSVITVPAALTRTEAP